jgi:hypothetical protein
LSLNQLLLICPIRRFAEVEAFYLAAAMTIIVVATQPSS